MLNRGTSIAGSAVQMVSPSWARLYGQLLAGADPSRALEILRISREAFQLLGMTADVNELDELIGKLEQPEQPPGEP